VSAPLRENGLGVGWGRAWVLGGGCVGSTGHERRWNKPALTVTLFDAVQHCFWPDSAEGKVAGSTLRRRLCAVSGPISAAIDAIRWLLSLPRSQSEDSTRAGGPGVVWMKSQRRRARTGESSASANELEPARGLEGRGKVP